MSKILFITDRFLPTPSANTICTINIIQELKARGHEIIAVSVNQDEEQPFMMYESIPLYGIKDTKFGKLLQLKRENKLSVNGKIKLNVLFYFRKIKNIMNVLKFPDVEPTQSRAAIKLVEKLYKENAIQCIIGVYRPFSGVAAAIEMKKKHPELLCGAYYLDLIYGATKPSLVPNKLYEVLCYRGELKAFVNLDFILMAKGGERIYSKDSYRSISSKIKYIDFPVFYHKPSNYKVKYESDKINFVYAGTLDRNYRNPTYMLNALEEISAHINNVVIHIYGSGNCASIINQYKEKDRFEILEHGMVSHDHVLSAMQQADFLINISNNKKNIVPSKIFELFSTGKPILNFMSNKDDYSKQYFDKYPCVCMVTEWNDMEKEVEKLKCFIETEKGKSYSIEELEARYIENTPGFTADIIESTIRLYKENDNG